MGLLIRPRLVLPPPLCAPARAADAPASPWDACRTAADAAEAASAIPPGLLRAIGIVESGRSDPLTGRPAPWPWTVNVAGTGHTFPTAADAIAHVRTAQAAGVRSIDVGCFQVNLQHHPDAFAALDDAFDPARNGSYAARFLTRLRAGAPSWEAAVGHYHSASPWRAEPYAGRVVAAWAMLGGPAPAGSGRGLGEDAWPGNRAVAAVSLPTVRVFVPGSAAVAWPRIPAGMRRPAVFLPSAAK